MANRKPTLVFLMDVDFWRSGAGCRARSRSLIQYLSPYFFIHVIYTGTASASDPSLLKRLNPDLVYHPLDTKLDVEVQMEDFKRLLSNLEPVAVFFRSWNTVRYRPAVPKGIITYFDLDDFPSEVEQAKNQSCLFLGESVEFRRELEVADQFDRVLLIQLEHMALCSRFLSPDKLLHVSHAVKSVALPIRKRIQTLGFLSSAWKPNIVGLNDFMRNVWPKIYNGHIEFHIYGYICSQLAGPLPEGVKLRGSVLDETAAYANIDVAINPVAYGSGIKVKTLEMLAHRRPTVVSHEGGRGLRALDNSGLFVAENSDDFAKKIVSLFDDHELNLSIAQAGYEYIQQHHSTSSCYGQLLMSLKQSGVSYEI